MKINKNQKKIIWLYVTFDFMCTMVWLYLNSLPKNVFGLRVCESLGMAFRPMVVNSVGIVSILGWCFFIFYIIQLLVKNKYKKR